MSDWSMLGVAFFVGGFAALFGGAVMARSEREASKVTMGIGAASIVAGLLTMLITTNPLP